VGLYIYIYMTQSTLVHLFYHIMGMWGIQREFSSQQNFLIQKVIEQIPNYLFKRPNIFTILTNLLLDGIHGWTDP
jgi:hypothetical protein